MMEFASFSHTGPRSRNEDRLLEPMSSADGCVLAAVADGIGGSDDGALAADLAIASIKLASSEEMSIEEIFSLAKETISEHAALDPELVKIGTTLSLCRLMDGKVEFGHVGDSRIYLMRGNGLRTLTKDQTEIAELVEKGIFSRRQAVKYPRKGVLTSALTNYSDFELLVGSADVEKADRLLVLTDGVYECVSKAKMVELSLQSDSIHSFVTGIESSVRAVGPKDNYSVVAIEI